MLSVAFKEWAVIGAALLSFTLSLFMLSLLGLPLTAGFMGKVMVFRPALAAGNSLLAILVVVFALGQMWFVSLVFTPGMHKPP